MSCVRNGFSLRTAAQAAGSRVSSFVSAPRRVRSAATRVASRFRAGRGDLVDRPPGQLVHEAPRTGCPWSRNQSCNASARPTDWRAPQGCGAFLGHGSDPLCERGARSDPANQRSRRRRRLLERTSGHGHGRRGVRRHDLCVGSRRGERGVGLVSAKSIGHTSTVQKRGQFTRRTRWAIRRGSDNKGLRGTRASHNATTPSRFRTVRRAGVHWLSKPQPMARGRTQ